MRGGEYALTTNPSAGVSGALRDVVIREDLSLMWLSMVTRYVNFDVRFEKTGTSTFRVCVSSPAGEARNDFVPTFAPLELENFFLRVGRSRAVLRRADSPDVEVAKRIGERLFNSVFVGEALACLRSTLDAATVEDGGVRVRFNLAQTPHLADYPWEYPVLFSPEQVSLPILADSYR